jgi:3-hydroxy-D-aspartate aldolase
LLLELDPFERNVAKMAKFIKEYGVRHRGHAKCHKSADIAAYLAEKGGTCGICCQKVSEAEAMVSGGVRDVLVSNEVTTPKKIERLAALATRARVLVCVDDLANVDDLSAAAQNYGVTIECLVEIDAGAGRCGVKPGEAAVGIAKKIDGASSSPACRPIKVRPSTSTTIPSARR